MAPRRYEPTLGDASNEVNSRMPATDTTAVGEKTPSVDLTEYFYEFWHDKCCGECIPCREGTEQILTILERMSQGHGREHDTHELEELGDFMAATSKCGLGKKAGKHLLSALRGSAEHQPTPVKQEDVLSVPAGG